MQETPVDIEDLREQVKGHLRADRALVRGRGHDWTPGDAADVVVREYGGMIAGAPAQRLATLSVGADLRRAASATREHLGRMMEKVPKGTSLHRDLFDAFRMLDVQTVGERLDDAGVDRGRGQYRPSGIGRPSRAKQDPPEPRKKNAKRGGTGTRAVFGDPRDAA